MAAKALIGFFCFLLLGASPAGADSDFKLEKPHPELYRPLKPPVGELGLPLGTFAVIEGTYHPYNMTSPGFELAVVNGKKLPSPRHIPVDHVDLIDNAHYVFHGYEIGGWGGRPENLPKTESFSPQSTFAFFTRYVATSIEKKDGVIVADTKPLDPNLSLAVPDFAAQPVPVPLGVLGLPLGTFAVIQARTPAQPLMMAIPFEVTFVNGTKLDSPVIISISNLLKTPRNKIMGLSGYETGEWIGEPSLPESEYPPHLLRTQQPFHYQAAEKVREPKMNFEKDHQNSLPGSQTSRMGHLWRSFFEDFSPEFFQGTFSAACYIPQFFVTSPPK